MVFSLAPSALAAYANEAAFACGAQRQFNDESETSTIEEHFIYDPGDGCAGEIYIPTNEFIDNAAFAAYLQRHGYDRNFLLWAPVTKTSNSVVRTTKWAGCITAHTPGTVCTGEPGFGFSPMNDFDGPVTVKVSTNGYIVGLVCGNFNQVTGSAPGPVPTISGTKYEDLDGDGTRDPGEPGVGGFTIVLNLNGAPVAQTVTATDGAYFFSLDANTNAGIGAGTYSLSEVQQNGWVASATPAAIHLGYAEGGTAQEIDGRLVAVPRTFTGYDFGNYRPAALEGSKVEDMDADGSPAGDPGLADWSVTATGADGPHATTTTADGSYRIDGLRTGTYTVTEASKLGWTQSFPAAGSYTVTLTSGQTVDGLTFANWRPGAITGVKFDDHDVDGIKDDDDTRLPDWKISVAPGPEGEPTAEATTAADGTYSFAGLRPGSYVVSEEQRVGWRQTAPATGTHSVRVRSGLTTPEVDFGNVCLGSAAVTVRDQATGAVVEGLEVRIVEKNVPGVIRNDPQLPWTTHDGSFPGLLPGTYTVIVFLADGVFSSDPDTQVVEGRWATVKTIVVEECETAALTVDVFRTSRGKVTGGMRELVPGDYSTAGFEFMTYRGTMTRGTLQYNDHATGMNLHADEILALWVNDDQTEATVWGVMDYEGEQLVFRLVLTDLGEPGTLDGFELDVLDAYRAGIGQQIHDGNVQIHKD
jgi:hypothetical protein